MEPPLGKHVGRPRNHYELLWNIVDLLEQVALAKAHVRGFRVMFGGDAHFEAMLDHKSTELNETEIMLKQLMIDVPQSN